MPRSVVRRADDGDSDLPFSERQLAHTLSCPSADHAKGVPVPECLKRPVRVSGCVAKTIGVQQPARLSCWDSVAVVLFSSVTRGAVRRTVWPSCSAMRQDRPGLTVL
jgi:hypothetical protein